MRCATAPAAVYNMHPISLLPNGRSYDIRSEAAAASSCVSALRLVQLPQGRFLRASGRSAGDGQPVVMIFCGPTRRPRR